MPEEKKQQWRRRLIALGAHTLVIAGWLTAWEVIGPIMFGSSWS